MDKSKKAAPLGLFVIFTALSIFFWWAFYERYLKYAECIAAANSSCVTSSGDNLISGGMLWVLLAMPFSFLAVIFLLISIYRLVRKPSGDSTKP